MTYAVMSEVQGLIPYLPISASSKPTTAQAQFMLDGTEGEVNAVLGAAGIITPVTTPSDFLAYVTEVQTWGTAAEILKAAYPESIGPGTNPGYAFWADKFNNALGMWKNGIGIPLDQAPNASTYFTRNPEMEEVLGALEGDSQFKIADKY